MSLRGLADLSAPLAPAVVAAFEDPDVAVALPASLALADQPDGRPQLLLERFRGVDPTRPPAPYGLLTVGLALVAGELPAASPPGVPRPARLARALPVAGVLRVEAVIGGTPVLDPTPVAWDGAAVSPWSTRLDAGAAEVVAGALGSGLLLLTARADLLVPAVARRVPVRVGLDWPMLASELSAATGTAGRIARDALVSWLRTSVLPRSDGPVRVLAGEAREDDLADSLADWLAARFADVPEPGAGRRFDLDPTRAGSLVWDLATPLLALRDLAIHQDLTGQLAALGPDARQHVVTGRTVPTLDLGWQRVDVLANLPAQVPGVLALGVDLVAAPRPPQRPQAAVAAVELDPGHPRGEAVLRLAPGEALSYTTRGWALLGDAAGVHRVEGVPRSRDRSRVVLTGEDLGLRLVRISADRGLLDLADVEVRSTIGGPGATVALTRDQPEGALVVPPDTPAEPPTGPEPSLVVLLRSTRDDAQRELGPLPLEHLWLATSAIPGWGPHTVTIDASACPDPLVVVELRPELDDGAATSVIALRAPELVATWTYLAADPLHPGYMYRTRPVGAPGPWRGPLDPERPLVLDGAP